MRAVVVDDVKFEQDAQSGRWIGLAPDDLPATDLSADEIGSGSVAVVSWRWDMEDGRSSNLSAAALAAYSRGIKYLLVDHVSIDQKQPWECLVKDIVKFHNFYAELAVFCAYDTADYRDERIFNDWHKRLYRPWIFGECVNMLKNPQQIYYIGFDDHQGIVNFPFAMRNFDDRSLVKTLMYLLCNDLDMRSLIDLQHLIPHYRDQIFEASRSIDGVDFLFFCFLVEMQPHPTLDFRNAGRQLKIPLHELSFNRFRLIFRENREFKRPFTSDIFEYPVYDISFDDQLIGEYHYLRYVAIEDLDFRVLHRFSFADNALERVARCLGLSALPAAPPVRITHISPDESRLSEEKAPLASMMMVGQLLSDTIDWKWGYERISESDRL